jgi:hypothetical protein
MTALIMILAPASAPFDLAKIENIQAIAPWWDKITQTMLLSQLETTKWDIPEHLKSWLKRKHKLSNSNLKCTGIVYGSLVDNLHTSSLTMVR